MRTIIKHNAKIRLSNSISNVYLNNKIHFLKMMYNRKKNPSLSTSLLYMWKIYNLEERNKYKYKNVYVENNVFSNENDN